MLRLSSVVLAGVGRGKVARVLTASLLAGAVLAVGGNLAACGTPQGKTVIMDPDADDNLGGSGTDSGDIRSLAQRISRSMMGIRWPQAGVAPRIAVLPMVNQTRFRVDPILIQNRLTRELVNMGQGRVEFLARDSEAVVLEERAKKRAGLYDAGNATEAMAGADYLLFGEMRSLTKSSGDVTSDYIVYSFKLVNAETQGILWMDDFETKKLAETGVIYQ
jgi:TolB-like protein